MTALPRLLSFFDVGEKDHRRQIFSGNCNATIIGSLSTRDFDTRTGSGSELFSLITRLQTITFAVLSTFSRLWMISIKMCETPLSWYTECSLPVAVRISKACVLKLPNVLKYFNNFVTIKERLCDAEMNTWFLV